MKCGAAVAGLALLGAAPGPELVPNDIDQLLKIAIAVSTDPSQVQPPTKNICVQRELEPPLEYTKGWKKAFQNEGSNPQPTSADSINRALAIAISPKADIAPQTRMPKLPANFILFSKGTSPPVQCRIQHGLPVNGQPIDESSVALTFTRPAFANGYAFIDEYEDCPGLCGTTFLRVFRKQNGKWTQVERAILSVS